jgi:metallo-beta-lactamase family protein
MIWAYSTEKGAALGIEIQFLGAVGTVTGSQFLVSTGERHVLVDCGMFQGSPDEIARNRIPFAFQPSSLDAVLVTHAHLDHCGRLPALVKAGFAGPIHATTPSADLIDIVLRDSAKLQEEFAARWKRRHPDDEVPESEEEVGETGHDLPARLRQAKPAARAETREALYTAADVDQTMSQMRGVAYDTQIDVTEGIRATFHDAGHILGSAIIQLEMRDGEATRTVVFSGDLGRSDTPILRDPTPISHAEYVLVESTYGNREHAPHEQATAELVQAIADTSHDKGVLLIPSFAIGRTQELIWVLDELLRDGRIPHLPLFLDSPMASRASEVYARHPEAYDDETAQLLRRGDSPLMYPGEVYTDSVDQSKSIRTQPRPMMVVASSGMLTGGRIIHHLKDFLPDPACTLLFIGYQGEGTLGRHLQDGGTTARIDGQEVPVRCRVRSISGFSAHADEHELAAWLSHFTSTGDQPKRVFVVHGDPDAAEAFAERIRSELRMDAYLPKYEERVQLA